MAKLTVRTVEKALEATNGNISATARQLQVSRTALYKKIGRHESLQDKLYECREVLKDLAEGQLTSLVMAGYFPAIAMVLKSQGRDRGWGESYDINQAVVFKVVDEESND